MPRRFAQMTLRTLLVLMAVLAAGAAWYGNQWRKSKQLLTAIERIEACGGAVIFDYNGPWSYDANGPPGPMWLAQAFGDESAFAEVNGVTFYDGQG